MNGSVAVFLILIGKIRIDSQEFTPTNAARYWLRMALGSRVYVPFITHYKLKSGVNFL